MSEEASDDARLSGPSEESGETETVSWQFLIRLAFERYTHHYLKRTENVRRRNKMEQKLPLIYSANALKAALLGLGADFCNTGPLAIAPASAEKPMR